MSRDPTAFADHVASRMRAYYECVKPRWWQWRKRPRADQADNLMLGLLQIVEEEYRVTERLVDR